MFPTAKGAVSSMDKVVIPDKIFKSQRSGEPKELISG